MQPARAWSLLSWLHSVLTVRLQQLGWFPDHRAIFYKRSMAWCSIDFVKISRTVTACPTLPYNLRQLKHFVFCTKKIYLFERDVSIGACFVEPVQDICRTSFICQWFCKDFRSFCYQYRKLCFTAASWCDMAPQSTSMRADLHVGSGSNTKVLNIVIKCLRTDAHHPLYALLLVDAHYESETHYMTCSWTTAWEHHFLCQLQKHCMNADPDQSLMVFTHFQELWQAFK